MINRRTQLLAIGIILILGGATGYYWRQYNSLDHSSDDHPDTGTTTEKEIIYADINATVSFTDSDVYRGDNYNAEVTVLTNTSITLQNITLSLDDNVYNRTGQQTIKLGVVNNDSITVPIEISPAFPDGDAAVIAQPGGNYSISVLSMGYNTSSSNFTYTFKESQFQVSITDPPVYDQAPRLNWSFDTTATVQQDQGNNITIVGTDQDNFELRTTIETTGYARVKINSTLTNASVTYYLNGDPVLLTNDYISIGNLQDYASLWVIGSFNGSGSLNMVLSIPTKHITLFAVIVDNTWDGSSQENFVFRSPQYYLKEVSERFEQTLNLSIIPGAVVPMFDPISTDLFIFAEKSQTRTGNLLGLFNNTWAFGPGTFKENKGFDILLIFTNKTMSHLGIVLGTTTEGAFNMAIHTRGSLYTGNYRLPPAFADNLIQHEVSHIFGAPDRYTSSDLPSVMSKSHPGDAVLDLLTGDFWLYQTHWLEQDIQTMLNDIMGIYWNLFTG